MTAGSQNARILAALADGCWHTTEDIHRVAGYSRLNSRVSELRARGHRIDCEQVPGETGVRGHRYRLVGLDGAHGEPSAIVRSVEPAHPAAPSPRDGQGGLGTLEKAHAPNGAGLFERASSHGRGATLPHGSTLPFLIEDTGQLAIPLGAAA